MIVLYEKRTTKARLIFCIHTTLFIFKKVECRINKMLYLLYNVHGIVNPLRLNGCPTRSNGHREWLAR